jgi:hypothetical protein
MLDKQGGLCAICGNTPAKTNSRNQTLHVDHCHSTGVVRELLCQDCNRGLGCFKDNAEYLLAAAQYINRWQNVRMKMAG